MTNMIGVCGSGNLQGEQGKEVYQKAVIIGQEIAQRRGIVICGGKQGVMEAVCQGAKQKNGLTIGVLPYDMDEKNPFVDIPIISGIGEKRNGIIIQSADCIIAVSGGWGTLNEIILAVMAQKPLVLLRDSFGSVDGFLNSGFADQLSSPLVVVDDPVDAVIKAFELIKNESSQTLI